jgi:hypothetical protein
MMRLPFPLPHARTHTTLALAAVLLAMPPAIDTLGLAEPTQPVAEFEALPLSEPLQQLTQLTQKQRLVTALHFQHRPLIHERSLGELQQARANALDRLNELAHLLPVDATAEIRAIEAEWDSLDADIARGQLSAAVSFARHTHLLDRQLALQATLRPLTS